MFKRPSKDEGGGKRPRPNFSGLGRAIRYLGTTKNWQSRPTCFSSSAQARS
jgi:hypothetical protein